MFCIYLTNYINIYIVIKIKKRERKEEAALFLYGDACN